jgi:hypothetical protein
VKFNIYLTLSCYLIPNYTFLGKEPLLFRQAQPASSTRRLPSPAGKGGRHPGKKPS